jgi:transcriptional regulator GlxA family with amidase domain
MANSPSLSVRFLLFDGFSNMVLACLMEPLRALRDQSGAAVSWTIATPNDAPAESSSGLRIAPDAPQRPGGRVDLLVVVAGYGYLDFATRPTARIVQTHARQADTVLGADAAPWLLASAGLLTGARATVHWQILSDLAEAFPALDVVHDRFVMEGRIWTCGGASTALDLMLRLIGDRFGAAAAFGISTLFLHDAARREQMDRGPALSGKGSVRLTRVLRHMAAHMEQPLPLAALADDAGLSPRALNRVFQSELAQSPGRYYLLLRLSRARELAVETDLALAEIALRCGFSGTASLSKSFRRAHGYSIGKTRRTGAAT